VLPAGERQRLSDLLAVVADGLEGDQAGAAPAVEVLVGALERLLALVVAEPADQPVADLPVGDRPLLAVLLQDLLDLVEDGFGLGAWLPRGEPADPGPLVPGPGLGCLLGHGVAFLC
jgi:hypothetical protein